MNYIFLITFLAITQTLAAQEYSWRKLTTETYPGKQDDIYFVNENTGWYVNGYGKIFKTTDGGATWTKQLEQKGTFFRCITFADSLTGFAGTVGTDYFPNVTDTIPLYKTTDGGATWTPVQYSGPTVKGLCAIDIMREQFINHGEIGFKTHIYAVGRVGTPAFMLVSHDGGESFKSVDLNSFGASLYDIKMFDKNEGIACSSSDSDVRKSHARILSTSDGGMTWQTVYESTRPFEISWKCFFPTREIGYATVQHYNPDTTLTTQHIIKTTDGGKSWKEITFANDYASRPFGIGFIDEKHGYVGTMNSGYETHDGGETWQKIALGRATNKIRILKTREGKVYGYAIGVNVFKLE
jgi:photosystem II stability/assembly factor-like uncharacterized protein